MIVPLIIVSAAFGLTLLYASLLDLKQRRVPFRTWYPMLAVSIPMASAVYALEVLGLNGGQYLQYTLSFAGIGILLTTADVVHSAYRFREKPTQDEIFSTGVFWLVFSLPLSSVLYGYFVLNDLVHVWYPLVICIFCGMMYLFMTTHLFGGADGIVLIFIASCVPFFPIDPFFGYPPLAFFPFTVLLNAVIFSLLAPLGILFYNLNKGNRAPLRYMCVGYPVKGDRIEHAFGVVMEEFKEEGDHITRHFIPFRQAISRMVSGKRRIITQNLKRDPDAYTEELALYRKAGEVWISYGVPFIVPITAGFISAIFLGDLFFTLLNLVHGV